MRSETVKKLIPILIFLICIIPLVWPSNWPIIYPKGWWKITLKLPAGKALVQEERKSLPDFKLSEGMLHISPGGKHTVGLIKRIVKNTDGILVCLTLINEKEMVIPADYGTWIDLEEILKEEWTQGARMNWD